MKAKFLFYRMWLSIIATNVVNMSMLLVSFKSSSDKDQMGFENAIFDQLFVKELEMVSEKEMSQLERIRDKNTVRVAIVGDKAYWVHDNTFYESDIIDGSIDNSAARAIDAHKLSTKQLVKLLEILDQIKN